MTKVCTKCNVEKPPEDFQRKGQGLMAHCKDCERERKMAWRHKKAKELKELNFLGPATIGLHRCGICCLWKVESAFYPGKINRCKECLAVNSYRDYHANPEKEKQKSKEWRQANPDRVISNVKAWKSANPDLVKLIARKSALKTKYGLTVEEYVSWVNLQEGCCAACGKPPEGKPLCVDHDHTTNEIRGLLCHNCNAGIGMLGDSLSGVEQAVRYLQRFEAKSVGMEEAA